MPKILGPQQFSFSTKVLSESISDHLLYGSLPGAPAVVNVTVLGDRHATVAEVRYGYHRAVASSKRAPGDTHDERIGRDLAVGRALAKLAVLIEQDATARGERLNPTPAEPEPHEGNPFVVTGNKINNEPSDLAIISPFVDDDPDYPGPAVENVLPKRRRLLRRKGAK